MADPVSWFMIERGWKVADAAGESVGTVDEVVGDSTNDIFNGLAISTSMLGSPKYVPAEQVGTIVEGEVALTLSKDEVLRLGDYDEPPTSAQILPDRAGTATRAEAAVDAPLRSHPEPMNVWQRIWLAIQRALGR